MPYQLLRVVFVLFPPLCAQAQESVWARSSVSGHWYGFPSATTSWTDGEAIGVALGGHLASLESVAEIGWIQGRFADFALVNYWIGLNDRAAEGTFAWSSGETFAYSNWGAEQPNDATGADDAVEVRPTDGWRWYDSYGPSFAARKPLMETVGLPRYGWTLPESVPALPALKRVALGDFDANGMRDIAFLTTTSVGVVLGTGSGAFGPPITFASGENVHSLGVGDFDQDGLDDLAVGGNTFLRTHLSLGTGGFASGATLGLTRAAIDLAVADFNGDTRVDVCVTVYDNPGGMRVFLADGAGSFLPPVEYASATYPQHITTARIDDNASIDIVMTCAYGAQDVWVYLNDGSGTFTSFTPSVLGQYATRAAAADLDGDGFTDLAFRTGFPNAVSVILGHGNGQFTQGPQITTVADAQAVRALDIEGDGQADLAVTSPSGDVIGLHKNRNGVFLPVETIPCGNQPAELAIGDLDGDDRADIAVVSGAGAGVVVLRRLSRDCNQNGRDDPRDIELGSSSDLNANGEPDECESAGSGFCAGDGTGTSCPCDPGQSGDPGHGCRNSQGGSGHLVADGNPSAALDSVTLRADGLPATTVGLLFQGTQAHDGGAGAPFGDGLRCVSGSVIRLFVRFASGGSMAFGNDVGLDPEISDVGQVPATGATRYYQLWYRDAQTFCTSATWNLTNGVSIAWGS